MNLSGRVAIVTGASRGIGVPIAKGLAARGVNLVLAARTAEGLESTAEAVRRQGVKVLTVPTDVLVSSDLQNLVDRAVEEFGAPDILVNNAGIEKVIRFERMDINDIAPIIQTNLISTEVLTRLVLPHMIAKRSGHVVNIASMAGKIAVPYNTVYSSSKHGLVGFSWSLRQEMKPLGIGVSVVCPAFIEETGMFYDWSRDEKKPPAAAKPVSPEQVVRAVIKAIEKDKDEVLVTPPLGKVADVMFAVSPRFTAGLTRTLGLYRYYGKEAGRNS